MTIAYKFTSSAWIDRTLEEGSFRIGTAFDFRKDDGKDDGRADPRELSQLRQFGPGSMDMKAFGDMLGIDTSKISPGLQVHFPSGPTYISNIANAYLYCVSLEISDEIVTQMATSFDNDACLKISSVETLGEILTAKDQRLIDNGLTGIQQGMFLFKAVTYDQPEIFSSTVKQEFDPFSKRAKFKWQKEGRLVWPCEGPGEPFTIVAPEARRLMSRVPL